MALKLVVRKNSIRHAAEMLGVKPDTVCKWLRRAAEHSREVDEILMRETDVSEVGLDELWTIIRSKDSRRLLVARKRGRG
ncbi:MAG: helix-turn-helix domain-containing protein [Methanomassiliicoccales archaeon]